MTDSSVSLPEAWGSYVFDPVGFSYNVLGYSPQRWQRDVLNSLYSDNGKRRTAVKSCHNPGKTWLDAVAIVHFLSTRYKPKVLCTSPTAHQLNDNLWPEVHKVLHESKAQLHRWFQWQAKRVVYKADPVNWFASAQVARVQKGGPMGAEAVGLQGRHADHLLAIVDEGSGVDDAIWGAIEGSLASEKEALALVTGNPNCPRGFFFNAFHKHRDMWNLHTVSYKDSPQVSTKWAEELIKMYGIDHPWVQVKALGEFPDEVEFGLIPLWAWERATDPSIHEEIMALNDGIGRRALGVDVADGGDDRTVIARATGPVVHSLDKMSKLRTMAIAGKVMQHIEDFDPEIVVIDADGGYGAGVADAVLEAGYKNIVRWHGNGTPRGVKGKKMFTNIRAQLGWEMRIALMEGKAAVPVDERASIQATTIRYKVEKDGRTSLMSKDELKRQFGLESPDELDAIGYALAPALVAPQIENVSPAPPQAARSGRRVSRNMMIS